MKKSKKPIYMHGSLLRPLIIGQGAYLYSGGQTYHTSPVTVIHEQSEDMVHFETHNSNYHLSMSPFPTAAVIPFPVGLTLCAA